MIVTTADGAFEPPNADSPEAELLVRHYLADHPPIEALILGCTHYPLLRRVLERVIGDKVTLVDSAEVTAETVGAAFEAPPDHFEPGRVIHFVTGDPVAFAHTARVIGGVAGEIIPLPVAELSSQRSAVSDQLEKGTTG